MGLSHSYSDQNWQHAAGEIAAVCRIKFYKYRIFCSFYFILSGSVLFFRSESHPFSRRVCFFRVVYAIPIYLNLCTPFFAYFKCNFNGSQTKAQSLLVVHF